MVFRQCVYEYVWLGDRNVKMSAYKCGIGMVFDRCEYECDALIHRIVRIDDHNFQLGMHTVAHERVFYWDDLDIYVALPEPISMAMNPADILVTEFRVLCWSMDCIRPIGHCMQRRIAYFAVVAAVAAAVAFVANGNRLSSSSM